VKGSGEVANRNSSRVLLIVAAFVLLLVPVAAIAAGGFTDVPAGSRFAADIEWLADAGVTKGCNPPDNTKFCPGDSVTREQMAAFMRRLSEGKVVEAATADHAGDADTLEGLSSEAFMTKGEYDSDQNSVVDSAEVKIRWGQEASPVDMADGIELLAKCLTAPVAFAAETTLLIGGGLTLDPTGTDLTPISANLYYVVDGTTSHVVTGVGLQAVPEDGNGPATVPINWVLTLPAATYQFAILPVGADFDVNDDYLARCELTVTAYTGLGDTTDVTP
jgi:hypothetical protein